MNNEIEQPEQFGISINGEKARIRRNFIFANGVINLDINFNMKKSEDGMTLKQLDQASLNLAIQELQSRLQKQDQP